MLGVFMPTGSGAFSISTHPRSTVPTWEYNRAVALRAEAAGFDFLLAGARWSTLGGRMDFQGLRLESMTFITALAAVTNRVLLFPTVHTFVFHPLLAARMVNDANRISGGRCGINVMSGWVQSDFAMFGVTPRPPAERLQYNTEWLRLLKLAWTEDDFTFDGTHFQARNGYLRPKPVPFPTISKAGESAESRELVIREADWLFIQLPQATDVLRSRVQALKSDAARLGRRVKVLSYGFVLPRRTREDALRARRHPGGWRPGSRSQHGTAARLGTVARRPRGVEEHRPVAGNPGLHRLARGDRRRSAHLLCDRARRPLVHLLRLRGRSRPVHRGDTAPAVTAATGLISDQCSG
jgi:alkanesulfonate monooxygenase SsuD/methylene tetrahydromethanopterin reductase-like flavin-dependent oxidoreductase (luciferase family)